ncbi:hypothetical protein SLA_1137 [Streptomyces laurentii]|uniref:Uncharacterized protein n=1 Tax=Streptomyces laurentii TaxID=39478 RepID=A0A160NWK1_STRLU|nr:hypothetical protein SLA_1137 [Streptomyces laurentii]
MPQSAALGAHLQVAAEAATNRAQQENPPTVQPEPTAEDRDSSLQDRALARAAAAPSRQQQELPLWTGNDMPTGAWRAADGVLYDSYGVPQWRLKTEPEAAPPAEPPAEETPAKSPEADAYEPADIRQAFASTVGEAWADTVPPEHGTAEDLLDDDALFKDPHQQGTCTVQVASAATRRGSRSGGTSLRDGRVRRALPACRARHSA